MNRPPFADPLWVGSSLSNGDRRRHPGPLVNPEPAFWLKAEGARRQSSLFGAVLYSSTECFAFLEQAPESGFIEH
jgi:hypothetical protein